MKIKERDYGRVLEIVKDSIARASISLGIEFYVEEYYLYGSQLSDKENPNDIDIFIYASEWNDSLEAYNKESELLYQEVHDFLHDNQESFNGTPIDINIKSYDFDLDSPVFNISNY